MHHDVGSSELAAPAEAAEDLANPPFDAVAQNRVADLAAGGDTEARTTLFVLVNMQGREPATPLCASPVTAQEIYPPAQPLVAAQPFVPLRGHERLDAQALAALAAAA